MLWCVTQTSSCRECHQHLDLSNQPSSELPHWEEPLCPKSCPLDMEMWRLSLLTWILKNVKGQPWFKTPHMAGETSLGTASQPNMFPCQILASFPSFPSAGADLRSTSNSPPANPQLRICFSDCLTCTRQCRILLFYYQVMFYLS